jgi:hypothetical protein
VVAVADARVADANPLIPCGESRFLDSNSIQTANFSNDTDIGHLIIAWNELTSLDGIELPAAVVELYVLARVVCLSVSCPQ